MRDETTASFRARVRPTSAAAVVVAEGELDLVGAPVLARALEQAGEGPLVLDLAAVSFMDSSGLRSLLDARTASAAVGRSFALARPSEPVMRVLELVDLIGSFEILPEPPA